MPRNKGKAPPLRPGRALCDHCGVGTVYTPKAAVSLRISSWNCRECGRSTVYQVREKAVVRQRAVVREMDVVRERDMQRSGPTPRSPKRDRAPKREPVAITGKYDFHYLVAHGLLPPPTPEMVNDLRGKGLYVREKYPVRLGELIAKITNFLGVPICGGCSKRRMWLNRLPPIWAWWRT